MERIKVTLPTSFQFSTEIKIRISDINYGGHMGNDVFLSLVHEARVQFLQQYNYSEMNMEGISLIMTDSAIEYKRELQYGDKVKISVAATNFDKLGFDIYYKLEVIAESEWLIAAKVKTGMLGFNYITKKKTPIPDEAIKRFGF